MPFFGNTKVRAGKLRHRVTFQSRDNTRGAYGGQVETWTDTLPNVAASVEPLSGRETMAAQAVQSEVTHKISLRYTPGITAAMRVLFGARVFNIDSIINVGERNKEMQIMAKEGPSKG